MRMGSRDYAGWDSVVLPNKKKVTICDSPTK